MTTTKIVKCLKDSELFASISEDEIRWLIASLASSFKSQEYDAGDNLFSQGQENFDRVYVIEDGQVLLQRSMDIGNREAMWPLGLLKRGGTLGWSSLLYGPHVSTATATCQKPTMAISMEASVLLSLLEKKPGIGFKVMESLAYMLAKRLHVTSGTMETHR